MELKPLIAAVPHEYREKVCGSNGSPCAALVAAGAFGSCGIGVKTREERSKLQTNCSGPPTFTPRPR